MPMVVGCTSTTTESIRILPLPAQPNIVSNVNLVCGSGTVQLRNNAYCTPTVSGGNAIGQHFISTFVFGNNLIQNTSGEGPGIYNYYSNLTANVTAGSNYLVQIGHGGTSITSKAVWIDINQDGDFSDAGELFYTTAASNSNVAFNLGIPPSTYNGITRMRVAVSSGATITNGQSCSGFVAGEYEDYNLNVTGGFTALSWSPSAYLNTTIGGSVTATNLNTTTTYTLTSTDANGCTRTDAHTITKYTPPTITASSSADSVCKGSSVTLNGAGGVSYTWNNNVSNGIAFSPDTAAIYTVTGTDANSCTGTATKMITIKLTPSAPPVSTSYSVCAGSSIKMSTPDYCVPFTGYAFTPYSSMQGFTFGSFFNSSNSLNNTSIYSDFSNLTINATAGNTYSFQINQTSQIDYWAIYIDYNNNGTFESDEKVASNSQALTTNSYINGSITIPAHAINGKTRLRVIVCSDPFTSSCFIAAGSNGGAEAEDYSFNISGGLTNYTWAPSTYLNTTQGNSVIASTVLNATTYTITATNTNGCTSTTQVALSVFPNTLNVSISSTANIVCPGDSVTLTASGANQYQWSPSISNGVAFVPPSTTTYTVIGTGSDGCLDTTTKTITVHPFPYSFTAPNVCNGQSTQLAIPLNYCTPIVTSNLPNRDYIDTFTFNGNAIQSFTGEGPGNYNYYSNTTAPVSAGSTYNFTMGIGGTVANLRGIWVDYNQDGDFTDSGEFVWGTTASINTLTGSFTIPTTASNGITRMRVLCASSISGFLASMSCIGVVFGEYEDYNLNISGGINRIVWSPASVLVDTVGPLIQTIPITNNVHITAYVSDNNGCTLPYTDEIKIVNVPVVSSTVSNNSICPNTSVMLNASYNDATAKITAKNNNPINIPDLGTANPYPAVCSVHGLPASGVQIKRIRLNGFTHQYPFNVKIHLQSPSGEIIQLMNADGMGYFMDNSYVTFEDGYYYMPWTFLTPPYQIYSATFAPAYLNAGNYSSFSSFTGNLNGDWKLFAKNIYSGSTGLINSFELDFESSSNPTINWVASSSAGQNAIANANASSTLAMVTSSTTYTVTVTNPFGCGASSSVNVMVDLPPASFTSTSGNSLCVENANTTLRIDTPAYCIPTLASGSAQGNYYLTSFYLPDGVTTPWFISSFQNNYTHYAHEHQLSAGNTYVCTVGYIEENTYIHRWLDLNQDGDFYDADEYLGNTLGAPASSTVSFNVTLPNTKPNGYMRLRIAASNSGSVDPCGGSLLGEFEDYDIVFSGGINNPNIVWSPATNLNYQQGLSVNASNMMSTTTYTVTVTDEGGCTNTATKTITINPCGTTTQTNAKLFLQGYYTGANTMTTTLANQGQPSNAGVCDTILVELRDQVNTNTLVASAKSLLLTNGNVTANFTAIPKGYYYIVIKHRNGIETWSASPVLITNTTNYNFANAANKAFGSNQVEVESGVWALFSGDMNQDQAIDAFDYLLLDPDIIAGNSGYFVTDLNGDGVVDAFDYLVIENNITLGVNSSIP